jgi:hypothetical protein
MPLWHVSWQNIPSPILNCRIAKIVFATSACSGATRQGSYRRWVWRATLAFRSKENVRMKTIHQPLILATLVAAALRLSACSNKNENPPADAGTPPPAMSAQPAMPPVTEPPPMAPAPTSTAPAVPATTGSVH